MKMISYFTEIFEKVTFSRYLNLVMKLFFSDKSTYIHIYIIIHVILSFTHIVYIFIIKIMHRAKNAVTTVLFTFSWDKLSNSEYSSAIFDSKVNPYNVNRKFDFNYCLLYLERGLSRSLSVYLSEKLQLRTCKHYIFS